MIINLYYYLNIIKNEKKNNDLNVKSYFSKKNTLAKNKNKYKNINYLKFYIKYISIVKKNYKCN